jgi:DNA repair exonuclease SbcCD nuclease subunit
MATSTVFVIGDSHFDERSRFEECVRLHVEFAARVEREQPALVIHTGDLYHRASSPLEREAACAWLQRVAEVCPVVVVRGNHDARLDIEHINRLSSRHPILGVERPDIVRLGGVEVCVMPWPSRSMAAAYAEAIGAPDTADGLRAIMRWFRAAGAGDGAPRILAAHAMVRGSRTSLGQPLVGCDYELGVEDLELSDCDVVALGHIHMRQTWNDGGVFYAGSPRRTAFGEVESKGFTRVTFLRAVDATDGVEKWGAASIEHVELSATPMVLLESDWHHEHVGLPGDAVVSAGLSDVGNADVAGAEVRLRYNVPSDKRDAARAEAEAIRTRLLALGAASVTVEERVAATTRARLPEVAAANGLEAQLEAYWKAKGVSEERRGRLLSMARSLEAS